MKTTVIQIRLSDKEKDSFSKASGRARLSISEWARNILNTEANKECAQIVRDLNKDAVAVNPFFEQFENYRFEVKSAKDKYELHKTVSELSKDQSLTKLQIKTLTDMANQRFVDGEISGD